ncbi:MAG TPA: hypothetical protein VGJ19_05695 [Streptosporangiaceae bacterium]|jgi:hypothetical protein
MPSRDSHHSPGISTGDIQGTGIVVGHHSSAEVHQGAETGRDDVVVLLNEFLAKLNETDPPPANPENLRELAETARDLASEPKPKWHAVRSMVATIAEHLPKASALTIIISNVQSLIGHLLH